LPVADNVALALCPLGHPPTLFAMTTESEDLVLNYLRRIDEKLDRLDRALRDQSRPGLEPNGREAGSAKAYLLDGPKLDEAAVEELDHAMREAAYEAAAMLGSKPADL